MNGESSERRSTYVLNIIYNEYGIHLSRRIDPEKEMYQLWQSPGGKVEKDETSKQAVIRETYEETVFYQKKQQSIVYLMIQNIIVIFI